MDALWSPLSLTRKLTTGHRLQYSTGAERKPALLSLAVPHFVELDSDGHGHTRLRRRRAAPARALCVGSIAAVNAHQAPEAGKM